MMRNVCPLGNAAAALALALVCGLGQAQVHGFVNSHDSNGQSLRWSIEGQNPFLHTNVFNPKTKAIRYFLGSDTPTAANRTAELNAVRAAFDQWAGVSHSNLKFEEGGLIAGSVDVNLFDDTNMVFWARTSTLVNNGRDSISGATAFTYFSAFANDNSLAESDIVFNAVQFSWFTDYFKISTTVEYFIEAVALHEIGHFVGFDHAVIGGATMFARGSTGVNLQTGLAPDDISGARALYPAPTAAGQFGALDGRVLMNGSGVFGAAVILEDAQGNAIAGVLSRSNGAYRMPAIPPGAYAARVTPLDPSNAGSFFFRGRDIGGTWSLVETRFLPTANTAVTIQAGQTGTHDFSVQAADPSFRITRLRPPSGTSVPYVVVNAPLSIARGAADLYVGVYSPHALPSTAQLFVTGGGITLGQGSVQPNAAGTLNLVSRRITVHADAEPGLRSFLLQNGSDIAYANGMLEILPPFPDFNFDGLDDRFQRTYFPRFTVPEAGPLADPDGDGFTNGYEFETKSDPTDMFSVHFPIESVRWTDQGAEIAFVSARAKRYQLLARDDVQGSPWVPVGEPVLARSSLSFAYDPAPGSQARFYRIQALLP